MVRLMMMFCLTTLLSACAGQQTIEKAVEIEVEADVETGPYSYIDCKDYTISDLNKMRNEKGVNVIEINRCDELGYNIFERSQDESSVIADQLFSMIRDVSQKKSGDKTFENFFQDNRSIHRLSLLDKPQVLRYSKGTWSLVSGVEYSLLDMYMLSDYLESLDSTYLKYSEQLKLLLDKKSYFLYSLLAGRTDLTNDDFSLWDKPLLAPNHFTDSRQHSISQLLDILIAAKKYEQVERYKEILEQNYEGNPFKYFFLSTIIWPDFMPQILKEIEQLRAMGLDIFHYTDNYDSRNIYNDNLRLAIKGNLNRYDSSKDLSDYTLIRELASGLKTCDGDCMLFYMELAIKNGNEMLMGSLLDSLPRTEYSNEELSRLIWFTAKYTSLPLMRMLFDAFQLPEYMDFQDEESGLSAIGYAKKARGDKMVALLESHGYKSNSKTGFLRNAKSGWSSTKETVGGVGYLVQLLLFGYH